MCPLRFILVFFSAALAGYFAWRSVRSSSEVEDVGTITLDDSTKEMKGKGNVEERDLKKMIGDGFWVFVDMASGRYLWRNFKQMREEQL